MNDFIPIKPVTSIFDNATDVLFPPAEFELTLSGPAADYLREIIAKGHLFRIEGISFKDSLKVRFVEVR